MRDFRIKLLVAFLGIYSFTALPETIAQNDETESMRPYQILRRARTAEKSGDIFSAVDYYLIYNKVKPGKSRIEDRLGNLLFREKNYKKAKKFFLSSYEKNPEKYRINLFNYAQCLHSLGQYNDAKAAYEKFLDEARRDHELRDYTRLTRDLVRNIDQIYKLKEQQMDVVVSILDTAVNKAHIEFSPIPYDDDKLIFGSLRQEELIFYDPVKEELPVRKLYLAQKTNEKWKFLGEFDSVINHPEINTGNGAFSFDKKRFYFSRCKKEYNHQTVCKLYVSHLENNEWQKPEELPDFINLPFTINTMPSLGISRNNTDLLYYVSDRDDGIGGMDIWFTFYDSRREAWREPRNLGRRINTVGDEITPYYNIETKTLYFSSNGHLGLGGFDIFKAFGEARIWEDVQNIGAPINTSYDDQYFILNENRSRGFFTSNRPGGNSLRHETCCDNIYEFVYRDFIHIAVTGEIFGITDTDFYSSIHEQYVEDMTLNLDIDDSENELEKLYDYPISLFIVNDSTGQEYFIRTDYTSPGHYFFNLEQGRNYYLSVRDYNNNEVKIDFTTKGIIRSDTLNLDAIIINTVPTDPIVVKNIYYDFGSAELTETAAEIVSNTILNIMETYSNIIVEISSHTDSIGTKESNMELSQERAQSVVDFLMDRGIEEERLKAKGYGEEQPIAPNTNPDGTDNEEGRAMNRRTEFRIIGVIEEYIDVIYED